LEIITWKTSEYRREKTRSLREFTMYHFTKGFVDTIATRAISQNNTTL